MSTLESIAAGDITFSTSPRSMATGLLRSLVLTTAIDAVGGNSILATESQRELTIRAIRELPPSSIRQAEKASGQTGQALEEIILDLVLGDLQYTTTLKQMIASNDTEDVSPLVRIIMLKIQALSDADEFPDSPGTLTSASIAVSDAQNFMENGAHDAVESLRRAAKHLYDPHTLRKDNLEFQQAVDGLFAEVRDFAHKLNVFEALGDTIDDAQLTAKRLLGGQFTELYVKPYLEGIYASGQAIVGAPADWADSISDYLEDQADAAMNGLYKRTYVYRGKI